MAKENIVRLEDGTYWKLVRSWKMFGKYPAQKWVRYRDGKPIDIVILIDTPKSLISRHILVRDD